MNDDILFANRAWAAMDAFPTPENATTQQKPQPANHAERTANELRPPSLDDMIGQVRTRALLRRILDRLPLDRALDHVLLVGPSGVGKSTFANAIANELGVDCYQLAAPVSMDMLLSLREVMRNQDILFIDEIHQQAMAERRGRNASVEPEVLYSVLEDRTIVTPQGVLPYPRITVIGATTDEGLLPDPFVGRFPLRPVLEPYRQPELAAIARANAEALGLSMTREAAKVFARACRGTPRQINSFVRNAAVLADDGKVDVDLATEVVRDLNRTTDDGLTLDMQRLLLFLYRRGKQVSKSTGDVTYKASLSTLATALGKSRDQRQLTLRVEPFLIERGYLQVNGSVGRVLTPAGIRRARELSKAGGA